MRVGRVVIVGTNCVAVGGGGGRGSGGRREGWRDGRRVRGGILGGCVTRRRAGRLGRRDLGGRGSGRAEGRIGRGRAGGCSGLRAADGTTQRVGRGCSPIVPHAVGVEADYVLATRVQAIRLVD